MARKWLTAPELAAWRSFMSTLGPLMDAFEGDLAPHGLTLGDYEVLVHLSEAPERRMRMCDLAQALRLSPSGLTRRLDGLVRHGLVERRASSNDRRVMFAHLTETGFAQMMEAAPAHVAQRPSPPARPADLGGGRLAGGDLHRRARPPCRAGGGVTVGTALPQGFHALVANVGIKDDTDDFTVVAADGPCAAAGVFTRSSFAGPSVVVSRRNVADGQACAIVVVSKNANVATGAQGLADAEELAAGVAARLGCAPGDVLVASTGVIGRPYPIDRVRAGIAAITTPLTVDDAEAVARGIMTTDTVAKVAAADDRRFRRRVVGVAKGVGMIEPDMATLITLFFTDAAIPTDELDRRFRAVIERTFNCVSVDTDTSTSDTAIVLAGGAAGPVDGDAFEAALHDVALSLTKQVARDGEGATKLIEVLRRRRGVGRAGQAGRQGDRQLTAGQDRGARRRSELGPGGDGRRQGHDDRRGRPGERRRSASAPRRSTPRRSTSTAWPRCRRTCAART